MNWTRLTIPTLLIALLGGCVTKISGDTYCDLTRPLLFDGKDTVTYMLKHDRILFVDILVHNETRLRVCKE
mgnify:CR=1 FL=1